MIELNFDDDAPHDDVDRIVHDPRCRKVALTATSERKREAASEWRCVPECPVRNETEESDDGDGD